MIEGVDVASYQGAPDWQAVAAAGIAFAFTKVTEGIAYLNPYFPGNWANLATTAIIRGAYHFALPSQNSAAAEAAYFLSVARPGVQLMPGDLVAFDIEDDAVGPDISAWVEEWLTTVGDAIGCPPIVYSRTSYLQAHGLADISQRTNCGLWLAAPGMTPPTPPNPADTVAFWQYSSTGSIPGIVGPVDCDRFNGTLAQLKAYAIPAPPTPTWTNNDLADVAHSLFRLDTLGNGWPDWAAVRDKAGRFA